MDNALDRFVHDALDRGITRAEIEKSLHDAGWAPDESASALARWVDTDLPVPVPRPKPYVSAREAFLYLILFILLYLTAWSLGRLWFEFIDWYFPDSDRVEYGVPLDAFRSLRWAAAMLIIAFPAFLLLSRRIYRATRRETERRRSRVRKWLTYLTLFVAATVLLGDLIRLVFYLLQGGLTVPFLLKVLTVGGIAGAIFGYYLWDLKQDDASPAASPRRQPLLQGAVTMFTLVVGISLLWALWLAGSPDWARQQILDKTRIDNLRNLTVSIESFYEQERRLPESLEELSRTRGVAVTAIADPVTRQLYEYQPTDRRSYELCARFARASTEGDLPPKHPRDWQRSRFWQHGAGRDCFPIEIQAN